MAIPMGRLGCLRTHSLMGREVTCGHWPLCQARLQHWSWSHSASLPSTHFRLAHVHAAKLFKVPPSEKQPALPKPGGIFLLPKYNISMVAKHTHESAVWAFSLRLLWQKGIPTITQSCTMCTQPRFTDPDFLNTCPEGSRHHAPESRGTASLS